MARKNVELTADSSGAQKATQTLQASWINAAAKINVLEKVFSSISGAIEKVNEKIMESSKFFDAIPDNMALASVKMSMAVTEGQIKPMALAKQANVLMRGDLKLTQDQFDMVAKSAVALSKATGEDVETVFDNLSKALVTGATRSLSQYGIIVDATGTKQEKSAAVMASLTERYQEYSVEVSNAGDAATKAANEMELQTLTAAKNLDALSKKWIEHKTYMKDFWAGVAGDLSGTALSAKQQTEQLLQGLISEADNARDAFNRVGREMGAIANKTRVHTSGIGENFQAVVVTSSVYIQKLQEQERILAREVDAREKARALAVKTGASYAVIRQLTNSVQISEQRRLEIQKELDPLMAQSRKQWEAIGRAAKSVYEASVAQIMVAASKIPGIEMALKFGEAILRKIAEATKETEEAATRTEKSFKSWAPALQDVIREGFKTTPFERIESDLLEMQIKASQMGLTEERQKLEERIQIYQAYVDESKGILHRELEAEREARRSEQEFFKKLAEEDLELTRKTELEKLSEIAKKSAKERDILTERLQSLRDLHKLAEDDEKEHIAKKIAIYQKYMDELNAADQKRLSAVRTNTEQISSVVIAAAMAEKKALDGMSRIGHVLKSIAKYMKAEAIKYAAKSVGYLAEGVAATFWNPPAAAAAFAASKTAAAAAAMFAAGAGAGSALTPKKSGGAPSAAGGDSSRSQGVELAGAQSAGPTNITFNLGRGFMTGTPDDIARSIMGMIDSGKRRGRVR